MIAALAPHLFVPSRMSRSRFVSEFTAIATDTRRLWLPEGTDTTTSTDASSVGTTITHSATCVGRFQPMGLHCRPAVGFSAGANPYAEMPDANDVTFGNGAADSAFSLVALAQVTDTAAARVLIAKLNDNGATGGEWYWQIDAADKLQLALWDASAAVSPNRTSDAAITQGVPKLFAATYSGAGGATAANGITLYQDGVVIASTASNNASYVAMENTASTIEIGTFVTHVASFFRGNIGLLAVCGGALTAQNLLDIKALVNRYYGLYL